jgi:hypothetical protein
MKTPTVSLPDVSVGQDLHQLLIQFRRHRSSAEHRESDTTEVMSSGRFVLGPPGVTFFFGIRAKTVIPCIVRLPVVGRG